MATVTAMFAAGQIAGPVAMAEDVTPEDWDRTLGVNLRGPFLCARRAIPAMKAAGKGAIINISSTSARTGLPRRLPYVVSKAGVVSLTHNLARELGPYGIRVNSILPGAIRGERIKRVVNAKAEALGITPAEYERDMLRFLTRRGAAGGRAAASLDAAWAFFRYALSGGTSSAFLLRQCEALTREMVHVLAALDAVMPSTRAEGPRHRLPPP
jgi:NAD(P)-dependent dehydrogenase (short-subunit alcohol dehydrogenase family)